MTDGHRQRESWFTALHAAETHFRNLITSSSTEWKRITSPSSSSPTTAGKTRVASLPDLRDVVVHRKTGEDIYRVILDLPVGEAFVSLEPWKAVLTTPELRQEWDPAVEESHLLEVFDQSTRICKTNFGLGWPASPRDAVTISRSFHDSSTFLEITTSLPRSPDEPSYLRPSPPFVRSNVTLYAWCIQHIFVPQPSPQPSPQSGEQAKRKNSLSGRLRMTCFSQHDLRLVWNLVSPAVMAQQLSTTALGLLKTVMSRGTRIPTLNGVGNGVTIERVCFQLDREALSLDYTINLFEEESSSTNSTDHLQGVDALHTLRERRRLANSIECILPSSEGWDVQLSAKGSSKQTEPPWSVQATRSSSQLSSGQSSLKGSDQIVFKVTHPPYSNERSLLKFRLVIEVSGPTNGLRLNGLPQNVQDLEERDPTSNSPLQILQDVSSNANFSLHTASSISSKASSASNVSGAHILLSSTTERPPAAEKSILSRVRRNYIYFSSLLQEPEAKWKRITEARGVSITQLDSIDPTLVVYRAEATFVGVALWDLYSTLVTPGARAYWDKQHEDAVLLEDVNELTELWHVKTKPAWPANGRDAVVLKTVYKSPTTIHAFSFSADNAHLFPNIPAVEPNVIRTQIDLQGWAVEALSPTTTSLTLLEQSDPKGWANKTSIPQQMINNLAGIGEYAIKCGGPPVVTRLGGAKANQIRYDHERGSLKVEYEGSMRRRLPISRTENSTNDIGSPNLPIIECEIRCDLDSWASSLDIVVDPPPQSITCLRRHRLSAEGGGLWMTLVHDALFADDERLLAIVRRGPISTGKEKGIVMVNGTRVQVDVDELPEHEIKLLSKQKRVKPPRIPLDQPPVMSIIRKRRTEWDNKTEDDNAASISQNGGSVMNTLSGWATAPKISSPLSRFFNSAVEQATTTTQQAVAAITPATTAVIDYSVPSSLKQPMQYALEALAWLHETHARPALPDWTLVNDKGLSVHRKLCPEISPAIPVHKGEKVIEGVSAEELMSVLTEYDCQKIWDDRMESFAAFEAFGMRAQTSFVISKPGFPFRDRGFYVSSVTARVQNIQLLQRNLGDVEQTSSSRSAIFYATASFSPDSVPFFSAAKYNPYALPIGRVFVDGWILETLDPYTAENYTIPSTRCTRLVAVDYAGSIPVTVNSMINVALARSILAIEMYIKSTSALPITRLPAACLLFVDKKNDGSSWRLRRRDENRTLIKTRYIPGERTYRATLLLTLPSAPKSDTVEQLTPRSSRFTDSPPVSPELNRLSASDDLAPAPTTQSLSPSGLSSNSSQSSPAHTRERIRSSSSVFTLRGEVRPSTDFLVGEIIVDSKLYPDGYSVNTRSRVRGKSAYVSLESPAGNTNRLLPIAHAVYTMPSSPLHSSGLSTDRPTRHLLKLTLPTAQYQISTVQDPLTGEIQSAPPKPQWFLDLQGDGILVDVEIRPNPLSKRPGESVTIDGTTATIINEKESLTAIGRDELQDDRVSKMTLLSRIAGDVETLPEELKAALAVDYEHLISPAPVEIDSENRNSQTSTSAVSDQNESVYGHQPIHGPSVPDGPRRTSNGLLSFLNSYPNPLSRLSSQLPLSSALQSPSSASPAGLDKGKEASGDAKDAETAVVQVSSAWSGRRYPLSTMIIIALISFLIGSLLRSLLSPADFIYVVEEGGEPSTGWREIKRLLEVKYIVGGWDFQIAVVRRH